MRGGGSEMECIISQGSGYPGRESIRESTGYETFVATCS